MKLIATTPLAIIVETDDVVHLRAEDETGAFGILPGHANFITALSVSVVTWRDKRTVEHHLAVRSGVLEVTGGNQIAIAVREAIADDDLHHLESDALRTFRQRSEQELTARTDAQRLYLAAIRQIYRFLRSERPRTGPGGAVTASLDDRLES